MDALPFSDLPSLAQRFREELEKKRFVLLYAYNGTGKTRLSTAFKDLGKKVDENGEVTERDTLYFNAFTEDLFQWDNDLANDRERVLKINQDSRFFAGLAELEMDNRIRPLLNRYADFDFRIDTSEWKVRFSREVVRGDSMTMVEGIKVSRGEENIFIWCFFLAIVQLVLDGAEAYKWVKYVYIDDPVSSLDEHNAITVANHIAQMLLKAGGSAPPTVISSHHTLFFNVLGNEFRKKAKKHLLCRNMVGGGYLLHDTGNTPFFQHVSNLAELEEAQKSGKLYTHHFNMLRSIMEKTASFHGYANFGDCVRSSDEDADKTLHTRVVNIMSHGNYSLYEPIEMLDENKALFRAILEDFRKTFPFNRNPFNQDQKADTE
ncbi:MAG TPA: AAA family ATPase [Gammaproteobacteria bacterium]|nr:AAA family ATPase [Gammaproteobacteria bacterium]